MIDAAARYSNDQSPRSTSGLAEWAGVAALVALALALRLHRIGSQLWLDEISAVMNSIRRPLSTIASEWPPVASHVFYELWAHTGLVMLGETPLAVRLPAAIFGAAGVAAMYWLASMIYARRHAFFVAGLLAVSYHHIFFSQNARGYTALIFFYLLSTALLLRFARSGRIAPWEGVLYAILGALAAYSQPIGVFVLAGHGAAVIGAELFRRLRHAVFTFPAWLFLRYAALGALLTALLYVPFLSSMAEFAQDNAATESAGPRLGLWLVREIFDGLSAALMGPAGVIIAIAVGVIGLLAWYRRSPFALAILLAPTVLQVGVFVVLGLTMHPRYFAVALPVALLVGAQGIATLAAAFVRRLPFATNLRSGVEYAVLAIIVMGSALPLRRYYRHPKQDFLGAIRTVDSLAAPADRRVGVTLAGHAINDYYHRGYAQVESLGDLMALERTGQRLWLVTTLEGLLRAGDPRLYDHIKSSYRPVSVLPATVGDAEMRIYERTGRATE